MMTVGKHNPPRSSWSSPARVEELVERELAPQVRQIDGAGVYPSGFMHALGQLGVYRQSVPTALGGSGRRRAPRRTGD